LTDAVKKCAGGLEAPGAYLSGGVDSAGVCAVLSSVLGIKPKAFTVGFDDERFSEIPAAEVIARRLNLDWSSSILKASDFVPLMSRLVNVFDSPFEDSSAFPCYHGAEIAASRVGVVLTGDGPDQLLGGSNRHAALLRSVQAPGWRRRALRRSGFKHLCRMLPITTANESARSRIVRKLYRDSLEPGEVSYEPRIAPMMVQRSLYSPGFLKLTRSMPSSRNVLPVMEQARGRHPLEQYLHFDVHFYLHDCLLPKVERTCSAHSLECRMPYLERDLVDFVRGLPLVDRIHGPLQKAILRRSLAGFLPHETLAPGKSGFAIPRDRWFAGELGDTITDVLTDRRCIERGYFSRDGLSGILSGFFSGGVRYYSSSSGVLMALLTLELWHRDYIDQP
jgi:asparagine synthase (glutamine-hydrolysing)